MAPVNIEYIRRLPYPEKMIYVVRHSHSAAFAYSRLESYRAAAAKQMDRIWEAFAKADAGFQEPGHNASFEELMQFARDAQQRMGPVFPEIHLYVVLWRSCQLMLQAIVREPEFVDARKAYSSHRKHFQHYTAARNSFEHFDERLPGGKNETRVREIKSDPNAGPHRVFSGFTRGHYTHSDQSWNVNRDSLDLLNRIIDDVLRVIHSTIDERVEQLGG